MEGKTSACIPCSKGKVLRTFYFFVFNETFVSGVYVCLCPGFDE